MPDYRLYFLGDDGRIANVKEIDSPDDNAAIETAEQFIDSKAMELWDKGRKVKTFETAKKGRPPS